MMSKKINTNQKIYSTNRIISNVESSTGNFQQRSTDNQSICTCGKWRTDTHSTYGTIQTNLKSEGYCTCDEGKDISSCNCNKKKYH